jgi:hypothetical protein
LPPIQRYPQDHTSSPGDFEPEWDAHSTAFYALKPPGGTRPKTRVWQAQSGLTGITTVT